MFLQPARRIGKKFQNPVPAAIGGLSLMFKIAPEFFFNSRARSPQQPPGPFVTDASIYAVPPPTGLRITWMGHSILLLEIDGIRILIDPVWDDRAAPTRWAGPRRFFPAPLQLHQLPPLHAIVISHDHYDHLGAHTVKTLARLPAAAHAQWITPLGVAPILNQLGVPAAQCAQLDWMSGLHVGDVRITALPARHFSGRSIFNRFETLWASFAIAGPRHRVYYGADSGEWPGYAEIGQHFGPFDLSMFEIGAFSEYWSSIHMGPHGAVRSFRALGGHGLFMPIHWGLFDLALHPWKQPIQTVWQIDGLPLWSPTPGLPSDVVPNQPLRSEWWIAAP